MLFNYVMVDYCLYNLYKIFIPHGVHSTHSVKISDNIASPDMYKGPITLSQWILADCAKMTNNIASAEM